ncbi:hypothetical protein [Brevundimonas naejangsanensis]|uniref:hypothetical protein n=1 Tax=Brevundimonas naejangsanensis TaxID=588932 RepID=UPI00106CEC3C|nr:hypothetical protein [Brevundimonas naejangsanensis]QBQ49702.1 hypothetical protein E3U41_14005 [Brevundimonas naejangsanensis]
MKTLSLTAALMGATLLAAPALAQQAPARPATGSGAAAATLPHAFEGDAAPARPQAAPAAPTTAIAPDIARSEEALRAVIAAMQAGQIDYTVFTPDMAEQIRAQSGQVAPLLQQFGPLKSISHLDQQNGADVFRVIFEKQATDWVIGFDEEDLIAALLFRPAAD